MKYQPLIQHAADCHPEASILNLMMGHESYSPEQVGWTVKVFAHATSVWTELYDAEGNMRGGTCVDLYYAGRTDEDTDETYNIREHLPMFIVDDADNGDCILFVTLDPKTPDDPLIELNDWHYKVTPMLTT